MGFDEIDLSRMASSLKDGVIAYIEESVSDEERIRFRREMNAILAKAQPDRSTDVSEFSVNALRLHEEFTRALRAWHISVVCRNDPEWAHNVAAADEGNIYGPGEILSIGQDDAATSLT